MDSEVNQTSLIVAIACLIWVIYAPFGEAEPAPNAIAPKFSFEKDFKPFSAKYCLKCHTARTKDGGVFAINLYPDANSLKSDKDGWSLAADYLDARMMPPQGAPQPSTEDGKAVANWIRQFLKGEVKE